MFSRGEGLKNCSLGIKQQSLALEIYGASKSHALMDLLRILTGWYYL